MPRFKNKQEQPVNPLQEGIEHDDFKNWVPPCRVCGDKSSGVHYGQRTCEGSGLRAQRDKKRLSTSLRLFLMMFIFDVKIEVKTFFPILLCSNCFFRLILAIA